MSKLSKADAKAHQMACDLLALDRPLTFDERWTVVENWQESANHVNSSAGAFFTPPALACDFAIDVCGPRIVDLCAGIGMLSFAFWSRNQFDKEPLEFVCIEKNPDYVAVGKRVMPEATWICADVFDVPSMNLGRFNNAISNPPFGAVARNGRKSPRYSGATFEYHVIDIASDLAEFGTFIIPQMSAPFKFSGERYYVESKQDQYLKFHEQTGIKLIAGCGVDCEYHRDGWHGVSPKVEIVCAEFNRSATPRLVVSLEAVRAEIEAATLLRDWLATA